MNKKAIIIAPRALYVCAPAFDAEPDDEGWYGHVITCTEKLDGGWYKIVTPYRYEPYAHKYDKLFDKAEIARREGEDTKLLRVWALAGDVHTEATHNGNVLITLYRGEIVEKIEDELIVYINESDSLKIRISNFYKEILKNSKYDESTKNFIKEK